MLIDTKIIFTDEAQSDLLGKAVIHKDVFAFDLKDVSAVMPGNTSKTQTIIFLHGNDVLIDHNYNLIYKAWVKIKGFSEES